MTHPGLTGLTGEQRAAALEKAAEIRRARAELKEKLKTGQLTLSQVLDAAEQDEVVGKLKVSAIIQSMPGIGKVRATQIMEKLKIAESRRLRGLGDQQRKALLAEFASASDISRATAPGYLRTVLHVSRDLGTLARAEPNFILRRRLDRKVSPSDGPTSEIAVRAYLATDDADVADRIFAAIDGVVEALCYEGPTDVEIIRGSFLRRSGAKVKSFATSDELTSRLKKVERAIEVAFLASRQAQVDDTESVAVARLMDSLKDVPEACICVGSILLVKTSTPKGPMLLARNLTPLELHALERMPEIQTVPSQALSALAMAVSQLDPSPVPDDSTRGPAA